MFYKVYYSPYGAYARYALPWYVPGYGICTNPYECMSQAIIDSQIQNASQEITNTGSMVGTSQYINQTTV